MSIIPLFQSFTAIARAYQGRRASRCSALASGFHIPRLWRWTVAFIFRAFGAGPWLSYSAPLALNPAFILRVFGAQFRLFVQSPSISRDKPQIVGIAH